MLSRWMSEKKLLMQYIKFMYVHIFPLKCFTILLPHDCWIVCMQTVCSCNVLRFFLFFFKKMVILCNTNGMEEGEWESKLPEGKKRFEGIFFYAIKNDNRMKINIKLIFTARGVSKALEWSLKNVFFFLSRAYSLPTATLQPVVCCCSFSPTLREACKNFI